ncbi:MAG: hypothetical protein VCE43_19100, partial [Myxococcota bacterium]
VQPVSEKMNTTRSDAARARPFDKAVPRWTGCFASIEFLSQGEEGEGVPFKTGSPGWFWIG